MVITIVCDVLGEENNGTTIAAMNLIRYLKSQGHRVKILCADQNKKGEEDCFIVPNRSFGKVLDAYVEKVGVTLAKPDEEIVRSAVEGSDIVHIMVPLSLGMCAVKIAKEMNIPMTAGFHMQAENLTCYVKLNKIKPVNNFVYKYIWKHTYQYIDGIHYPTQFIRSVFEKNIKRQTPGYVISNGVHDYVQKRDTQKPEEFKDKIQLILGGQGPKEKKYRKLARYLKIEPIFKLFPRNEIIDVLNFSDLYVHPAEVELEGIACLEAIMCGKLTIVSDSRLSATKEFAVDDRCIFKCRKPKDLARVIDYWLDNPEEKKLVEQKYLESSNVFNQNECMKRMENMMFEVINKKAREKEYENS